MLQQSLFDAGGPYGEHGFAHETERADEKPTFDKAASQAKKKDGMATAANNRPAALALAKFIAERLAREHGTVNADMVGRELKLKHGIESLGGAAGSIFRDSCWEWTGEWVKSARVTNHSRMLRVWRLK
jgi:hypothetical protein